MASKTDKVIVTNFAALRDKYGAHGLAAIRGAIAQLIRADEKRGLQTLLIEVGSKWQMKSVSAVPVTDPKDPEQNKKAVDAIYRSLAPDYIMLLGSCDVIPHQDLRNPLFTTTQGDDPDKFAWGDLPYACEAAYGTSPSDFLGPTRVVGRLPDVTGDNNPAYLLGLLRTAAGYKSVEHGAFSSYFAVTAQVWEASTSNTLHQLFRNDRNLQKVPPHNDHWSSNLIVSRVHFFNCHGASGSSHFFGQPINRKATYPFALDARLMDGKVREGTIAAAECCYGGQLFQLSEKHPYLGVCNVYLKNKGYGVFASTTIAYGPARTNGQADLICRFFLESMLRGASLGRAALEARQNFVHAARTLDPSDLKTLAQFNLYGDPSLTPVRAEPAESHQVREDPRLERNRRHERRRALLVQGQMLAETAPKLRRTTRKMSPSVLRALRKESRRKDIQRDDILSFAVRHAPRMRSLSRALTTKDRLPNAFHVVLTRAKPKSGELEDVVHDIRCLIAKEIGGRFASVSEIYSR